MDFIWWKKMAGAYIKLSWVMQLRCPSLSKRNVTHLQTSSTDAQNLYASESWASEEKKKVGN